MADRRMISKEVFDADKFIDLSPKARLLYVYMILHSDDSGFTNGIKKLMFEACASNSDLKALVKNGYVIQFESGVYLIAHWLLMNKVQPSRFKQTSFVKELASVILNEDKVYELYEETEEQAEAIRKQIADDFPALGQQKVDEKSE